MTGAHDWSLRAVLFAFLFSSVMLACPGAGEPCRPTGQLGSCCEADSDCIALTCLEGLPGGHCTQSCEHDVTCTDDSYCVDVTFSGASGVVTGRHCLAACGAGYPSCRSDYTCREVPGADQHVCFPG